jgi:general secretion pathway protein D
MAQKPLRLIVLAAGLALVTSCSLMPPGMQKGAQNAPGASQASVPPQSDFGPTPGAANPQAAANAANSANAATAPTLHKGTGVFVRPPGTKPEPPGPEEASLNFEALDVREVAKVILGDYLKQSYTVDPTVTGTVTFRTVRPIAMKDLLATLEMLLRQNNAAVVKEEGIYKILPVNKVRGSVSPQLGMSSAPIPPGFGVLVVPLQYVGAQEMVKILEPFASDNTVRADPVRNLVILAGNQRELSHLMDTVQMFDVDWLAGYSVGVFPMKSVDVKTLMGDLDKVFGGPNNPLQGIVRVIPIERMNAVVVVTTQPRYLEMAKSWLDKIDLAGGTGSGGMRFFVYQVKNAKAENLAQLVGDLFSARRTTTTTPGLAPGARPTTLASNNAQPQTTTTTLTPPAGATFSIPGSGTGTTANEVRVIADKDTNSLLILATPGDYEVILNALKQLDVIRREVLVEVLLAEVTLSDSLNYGIDWYLRTRNNTIGALNTMGTIGPINGGTSGSVPPILTPPTGSTTGNLLAPANYTGLQLINLTGNEVRAVLQAFGGDGHTKVLAAPAIMVLDNEKAEIKVGDRISVQTAQQTGVSTGTGVVNSFQYLETGILLAVTPRINSGGTVTLDINQEVSQPVANSSTAANPNPNVSTRNAKTTVVVANGESVALGGLIQENNQFSTGGIPLLSKIPVLGALFGSQNVSRTRTELILLITPKIVSDPTQAREVTDELRSKLPSLEKSLPPRKTGPVGAETAPPAAQK